MDQPGKVANPARGQLNRENEYSPVPVLAWEFGLARRVQPSRPASACSSPYSGWIWCLLTGLLPSSAAASIWNRHTPSGQSRVYRVTQLRTDGVHCRESDGTGPVNLKVVSNGCCLGRSPWTNYYYSPLFPTPTIGMKWACWKYRRIIPGRSPPLYCTLLITLITM